MNAELETKRIIKFIQEYFNQHNLKGVVLGISGGKDSAVVAGLFSLALGSENVFGVTLPCHSKEEDKIDAKLISDYYGFKLYNLDLTRVFDTFKEEFNHINIETLKDSDINLKPRLRMASVYYLAQALSSFHNERYIVAGTSK